MNALGFTESLRYIAVGWRLLRTPGLRRFVWMPLLINLMVFGALGWWLNSLVSQWVTTWTVFESLADWRIIQILESVLRWLITAVLFFLMAFLFTLLANLIGAPFNGLLAERVEAHLIGEIRQNTPSWLTLVKSIPRLMMSELSKVIYLIICLIPLLLMHLIPVINIIAPALLFLFGAWMFALEYMDYPLGNNGALFRDVRKFMRKRRRGAYGFGIGVAVLSSIPIINLIIMPVAVAGATALYVDHLRDEHLAETAGS